MDNSKTKSEGSDANNKGHLNQATKPNTVKAEDTFITIQTKDGESSKRIPFYEFLEKVVGVKLERSELRLDIASLMLPGAHAQKSDTDDGLRLDMSSLMLPGAHAQKSDTDDGTAQSGLVLVKSTAACDLIKDSGLPKLDKSNAEQEASKPRGRGRPRKAKFQEAQCVGDSVKPVEGQTGFASSKIKNIKLAAVQKALASSGNNEKAVRSPRRSCRTPARNNRFKEDFVDSSTLCSKSSSSSSSSSSWNTQLMTLALAAERHETKPSKQSLVSRKKSEAAMKEEPVSKDEPAKSDALEVNSMEANEDRQKEITADTCGARSCQEEDKEGLEREEKNLNSSSVENEPSDRVLKRPLKLALNLALSKSQNSLSDRYSQFDAARSETVFDMPYFVVMEPKLDASGDGFLIQKSNEATTFNVADISGQAPFQKLNPSPTSYPLDRLFTCATCDSAFPSASSWFQHNQQSHGEKGELLGNPEKPPREVHRCPLCEEKFPFQFMLDFHLKKGWHGENDTHECSLCQHFSSSRKEMEDHWQMAHPEHDCSLCGRTFNDSVELRRHLKRDCLASDSQNINGDASGFSRKREEESAGCLPVASQEEMPQTEKVPCDICKLDFYTYSGLWHHKLEAHQQFYPPGFRDRLLERLEKNVTMLKSTPIFDKSRSLPEEERKNNYFVVMQPKWSKSKPTLSVSVENKDFRFSVADHKSVTECEETKINNSGHSSNSTSSPKSICFKCQLCGESFQLATEYREHRSRVHREYFEMVRTLGAFQCSQCPDTFPCQFMLDQHEKRHEHEERHDGKNSLPCTLCGLFFHNIQDRREHWRKSHPGIGCPNCGKMYASIKYLHKHISLNCQDHHPASKKSTVQKKHQNHFETVDMEKKVEKKILKCHLCPKICSSIHCWRRHMSEKHENDGFSKLSNTCIICNQVIYGYKALERHLLQEHAEESGLPIEEENTMVQDALSRSKVDIVHYQKAGRENDNIFQDDEGLYHCPECPKTHTDLKALLIHIKTHVNMQLECAMCSKTFKNPTLLKQHVMRHRTKAIYTCNMCGKKFVTLQKLNKHNKVHHCKEHFVCELCGMSFTLNDYLLKHKRCHTDRRPHSCSVCGKTFRTKPELRVHVLIHTQETPYVCEHCGRGFTQKGNWRIHLAQHTGHKPHQCDQCELSFALPSHLKRHLLTHNQKVNYRCIWCDKECTQRKHMQMHVVRVHREDFFQYEEQMKLETPVPIAPSQLKMYNRRLGKAGQVRRAYRTRAKKCNNSTSQDIMSGLVKEESMEAEDGAHDATDELPVDAVVEPMVETVTTALSLPSQDVIPTQEGGLQILVSADHQSYAKHGVTGDLIGDEASNVEIVMGDNNEINIIINNNGEHRVVHNDELALGESLEGVNVAQAALTSHFSEHATAQLHDSLQQAVQALVNGSKGVGVGGEEAMTLDIDSLGNGNDTYAIVYPS